MLFTFRFLPPAPVLGKPVGQRYDAVVKNRSAVK